MRKIFLILFFFLNQSYTQYIDVNNEFFYWNARIGKLKNEKGFEHSLNIKPISINKSLEFKNELYDIFNRNLSKGKTNWFNLKFLGLDSNIEYNSRHPYNRNNGSMIPNRGIQHILSPGFLIELGPVELKIKPEYHFAENKHFEGFWEDHYPVIWAKRYELWNKIDMPERFGEKKINRLLLGQSSLKINFNKFSIGLSSENLWWGPSFRNSIMLSNHAQGFKHITVNTREPLNTKIGDFEFQFITGRLENSGFKPPGSEREYAGSKLYVPKINQNSEENDWRFLQGFIFSYSPEWIDGLSIGFIRWVQMYSALIKGNYSWIDHKPSYLPVFQNLFRNNDKNVDYEFQTNQAAGFFLKWIWLDSKSEIYFEFHHNDSKHNIRDLLLDSDHSRAATIGFQKIFLVNNNEILFNWEWTQMEQNASRLVRNAGSWYEHAWVFDGYTNKGEVLGSSIGPGSNSHYFSISKIKKFDRISAGIEIVDNDNDFFHEAFSDSRDYRRYWKDYNLHINYFKMLKNFLITTNLVFVRSLNYQWELVEDPKIYYQPGNDVNNLHLNLKLTYFFK